MTCADAVFRSLTPGECAIAASVFGGALEVRRVALHRQKWFFLQPKQTVMAPNGHVWFHPKGQTWRDDFAIAGLAARALFVHELVHVWQHQLGINLVVRRLPFARYRYLPLTPGKAFGAYGLEQQACIVQDAYLIREGAHVAEAPELGAYAALIPFCPPTPVSVARSTTSLAGVDPLAAGAKKMLDQG